MSTLKKQLRLGIIIAVALAVLYFLVPFVWSAIKIGIKGMVFQWILDYGIYVILVLVVGGYIWLKIRKKKTRRIFLPSI